MSTVEDLTLNGGLVNAVIQFIDLYSKKGVFKLAEFSDISSIVTKLTNIKKQYDEKTEVDSLTLQELAFIVGIFVECTNRVPTAIESFGQLFALYQHYTKYLEQEIEKSKKDTEVPTVEELNELNK